jgi:hypothetical protein
MRVPFTSSLVHFVADVMKYPSRVLLIKAATFGAKNPFSRISAPADFPMVTRRLSRR